ncbi:hypothetical protein CLV62_105108 [Dysgonomonas alginatilytica]|uniref:Uncharacterized protein n=1 Tax=Dysgonomonas alginatilytica TaxID=1605892 RepID=A0A2V3PSZ1_9BACT|nr:hypothetical protein CLV62_105108 [Dysgonomonas alginatilytica]
MYIGGEIIDRLKLVINKHGIGQSPVWLFIHAG